MEFNIFVAMTELQKEFGNNSEISIKQENDRYIIRLKVFYVAELYNFEYCIRKNIESDLCNDCFNTQFYYGIRSIKNMIKNN